MDNKQAIEILKDVVMEHNSWNSGISFWDLDSAIHKAIASLEAWDKIKEELEKEMNEYENVLTDLSYSDGLGYALAIIEEHLKEIKE